VLDFRSTEPNADHSSTPLLEARGLCAGYGDLAAVRNVDLVLHRGEIAAVFGPNGAGKTTLLMTLAGALRPLSGVVLWKGNGTTAPLHKRVRSGMAFVPEERSVISGLTTLDNLRLGLGSVDEALQFFPQLTPLLGRRAGLLSGGEQQMLTLARAVASRPAALLVDELSLGLAPIIVDRLLDALRSAANEFGLAVLLVEQQARRAMRIADRWLLLRQGAVVATGEAANGIEELEGMYLARAV
jgi:branched-chain amino acid transport system ATP-binding protein